METQTFTVTITLSGRAAAELSDAGDNAGAVEEAVELWARRYDGWKPRRPLSGRAGLLAAVFAINVAVGAAGALWVHKTREDFQQASLRNDRAILDRLGRLAAEQAATPAGAALAER